MLPHSQGFQGVFTILVTPFDDHLRVDEESLRRLVERNLEAGVHGLGVALGSEVFRLTEAERDQVTRAVVDQSRGRVPVVINTGGQGTDVAVHYSRCAEALGADALMVMPPTLVPTGPAETLGYFRSISDAVGIPIFIQDAPAAPVGAGLARALAQECEWVRYIKVETVPLPIRLGEAVDQAGDLLTVFGGASGAYFIEELRRGSKGTMPSCSAPEAYVEVWERYHAGDEPGARELFNRRIAPIIRLETLGWSAFYHTHKAILKRRGWIERTHSRGPLAALDEATRRDVDAVIEQLYG
jgi:dihydrodipicolinate synthase/N-acetylneuraminate lyase